MGVLSDERPRSSVLPLWAGAVGWLSLQLVWVLLANGGKYASLVQWDAAWYRDIAEKGYAGANVAFFPAFPLLTRAVMVMGFGAHSAVLVASQLAALFFWFYFLLLLRSLRRMSPAYQFGVPLAFAMLPGAFHLVSGYSEPLFLAMLAGLVYWTHRFFEQAEHSAPTAGRDLVAFGALIVLHAGVLSATRIVGVPLAAYPFILALILRRDVGRAFALSAAGLWGFVAYLMYCHFHFGNWTIYWQANRAGWGVGFDLAPWMQRDFYLHVLPQGNLVEILGRVLTLLTAVGLIFQIRYFRRSDRSYGLALSILALGLLAETVLAKSGMSSMLRYLLPVHLLYFLAIQEQGRWDAVLSRRWVLVALVLLGVFQTVLIIRYCGGGWVS